MSDTSIDHGFSTLQLEMERFRTHINIPRVSRQIMANTKDWNQICSAMDLLGDNLYAIRDYVTQEWPKSEGTLYLLIYGLLQALILQQDAVEHISSVCSIPYVLHPRLAAIRDLRNNSSGHPSQRGAKKKSGADTRTAHFISRISLKQGRYQLMSSRQKSKGFVCKEVDLLKLIKTQQVIIRTNLKRITNELAQKDAKHRERFRSVTLSTLLSEFTDSYPFTKIYEAIDRTEIRPVAKLHVASMQKALSSLYDALTDREEMSQPWEEQIGYLRYPLSKLNIFFSKTRRTVNKKDAYIFTAYVQFAAKQLIDMAEEVDRDYAESVLPSSPSRPNPSTIDRTPESSNLPTLNGLTMEDLL